MKTKANDITMLIILLAVLASVIFFFNLLKKKLQMNTAPAPGEGSEITPNVNYADFPLRKGSKGEAVKNLQLALNKARNIDLVPDGVFGNATLKALKDNYGYETVSKTQYNSMVLPYLALQSQVNSWWIYF